MTNAMQVLVERPDMSRSTAAEVLARGALAAAALQAALVELEEVGREGAAIIDALEARVVELESQIEASGATGEPAIRLAKGR